MSTVVVMVGIALVAVALVVAIAIGAQKLADWWYDYSMRRELDKIIEKELRQSRREFRR